MKTQPKFVFRYIVFLILFFVLLRSLPLVVRSLQGLAVVVSAYWWAILPTLAVAWLAIRTRKPKGSNVIDRARDVTE